MDMFKAPSYLNTSVPLASSIAQGKLALFVLPSGHNTIEETPYPPPFSIVDVRSVDQDMLRTANRYLLIIITIHIDYLSWQPGNCWWYDRRQPLPNLVLEQLSFEVEDRHLASRTLLVQHVGVDDGDVLEVEQQRYVPTMETVDHCFAQHLQLVG